MGSSNPADWERAVRHIIPTATSLTTLLSVALLPVGLPAQRAIDVRNSVLTVRVYKSGLFSLFAHNHEIRAPIAGGEMDDSENPRVEFWVDAAKLRVVDSDLSSKDRAEVQKTMDGPDVLDIRRFPEVHFRSNAVVKTGANHWTVHGKLSLHGENGLVAVEVIEEGGRYRGSAALKQSDFGIIPIRIAGGTVKVKDQVKVEFEIVPMR